MILLGITGSIGHGKSTLSTFLQQQSDSSQSIESWRVVADIVEPWLKQLTHVPEPDDLVAINEWIKALPSLLKQRMDVEVGFEQLQITPEFIKQSPEHYTKLFEFLRILKTQPVLLKTDISDANKSQYRPILQWLGGYMVKHIDGIWYHEIIRRANQAKAQGCDLFVIGGVRFLSDARIAKAAGAILVGIIRPDQQEQDVNDPTEREHRLIKVDTTVINNGSLDELKRCAKQLYLDCHNGQLAREYRAHA